MKTKSRHKSLWSAKTAALTPDAVTQFTGEQIAALPESNKKGCVLYFIEALQRRCEQQQRTIEDLQRVLKQREAFIGECKRAFSELGPLSTAIGKLTTGATR